MRKVSLTNSLILLLTLMVSACSEELFVDPSTSDEGKRVDVICSLAIPESAITRAMDGSETPTINSLYLVVFDTEHYLKQIAEATPVDASGTELGAFTPVTEDGVSVTYFKVTLDIATGIIVHLVANMDVSALPFGSEGQIIGTLTTTGNQDVYWQRVENVTIREPLSVDEKRDNFIPAPTELTKVPLVRNYAKVTVTDNTSDGKFQMVRVALSNLADRGTVAPRITGNTFADYWEVKDGKKLCRSYLDLLGQGYQGNEAGDQVLSNDLTWSAMVTDPFYIYEHKNVGASRSVFVIIEGKYDTDDDGSLDDEELSYYKIDLIYKDAEGLTAYYNIIRNLWYKFIINSVASEGYSTIEEAIANPASNNLSGSTVIADLTNISDGEHHLFVDRTSIVIVNTNAVTFKYMYKSDLTQPGGAVRNNLTTAGGPVSIIASDGTVLASDPAVATSDVDNWRTVTLTPNTPTDFVKTQNVTVSAGGLERTVRLTLRKPYDMRVVCDPNTLYRTYNSPVTVKIYIPTGMPKSYFPLEFFISSDNNTIYPQANTDMPTQVEGDGTYSFLKQVRLEDYNILSEETVGQDKMKVLECKFMLNTNSAGATTVNVTNQYFNPGSGTFNQSQTAVFSNIGIEGTEYYGGGHTIKLKYTLASALASGNLSITLNEDDPDDAVGTTTYAITVNAADLTAGYHEKVIETQTFNGDVSITIQGTTTGTGGTTQTTTISNPKKRHLLYLPTGSFRFNGNKFPSRRWQTFYGVWSDALQTYVPDGSGRGYHSVQEDAYANDADFIANAAKANSDPTKLFDTDDAWSTTWNCYGYEYPDFFIDDEDCGSFPIWYNTGMVYDKEIDATYGGRVRAFKASSVATFTTYYLYYDAGDGQGTVMHEPYTYSVTLEELTNWYRDHGKSLEGYVIDWH